MLTQEQASRHLGISVRQIRRLTKRIALSGTNAIISKHSGGNRAFTYDFKKNILTIIKDKYIDFGPTFAAEKLELNHDLKINRETLRQWMITDIYGKVVAVSKYGSTKVENVAHVLEN